MPNTPEEFVKLIGAATFLAEDIKATASTMVQVGNMYKVVLDNLVEKQQRYIEIFTKIMEGVY